MRVLSTRRLGRLVESLCEEVSTELPADVVEALSRYRRSEESPTGRNVIDMILENAGEARRLGVPLCQDTGVFTVYLTLGAGTALDGDFAGEASAALARATERGSLRPSVVRDPTGGRENTCDNTPPLLEVSVSRGDETTLGVLAKGGGCEMASRVAMLPPGAGWPGVLDFILEVVERRGAGACPPLVLGVGIGGSFDAAPKLAKRALLAPLDEPNPDPEASRREEELVGAVNRLGIGPGALGGTVTCIGARILEAPCHMATLPVALCVNCHSLRRKVITI
ncbi:MAG: fumarate hydratase [Actinobacteria bacterium]|nr:fumarate hydratase [Actinomycetota bacterium]